MDKKLSECSIQDILSVTFVKEYIDGQIKDSVRAKDEAVTKMESLTAKITDLEKVKGEQEVELKSLRDKVAAIDAEKLSAKVNQLVDGMIKLNKPNVKSIADAKDDKKAEARAAIVAEYSKKGEVVVDGLLELITAEVTALDAESSGPTRTVEGGAAPRDSRSNQPSKRLGDLSAILDRNNK